MRPTTPRLAALLAITLVGCSSGAHTNDACVDACALDAASVEASRDGGDTRFDDAFDTILPDAGLDAAIDTASDAHDALVCDCAASCVTRACAGICGTDAGYCPVTHVFDLASQMPAHLAVMFSMSWFGIPHGDPNGAGSDPSYGNWRWGGGCVPVNDPATCTTFNGSNQRQIASRHRPIAGIYSSTGRDAESLARVDLMLSTLRRPCDDGARVDAWSVQIDSIKFTSRYLSASDPNFADTADFAYRASLAFYDRADAAGMTNALVPGIDTTWYWHFGSNFGLSSQADFLGALTDDLVDMVNIADAHPSALRVDGRLLLYVYTSGSGNTPYISASEWTSVLADVRNRTGLDVYVVGGTTNSTFFSVFDAIAPWIELGTWNSATGSTDYDRAVDWTHLRHDGVVHAVGMYPGRVVFGGITPGFDDYTEDWGACTQREIPRVDAVLDGQFDVLASYRSAGTDVRGMLLETWDDFTEGSIFEPEVGEGAGRLVHFRDRAGMYFGDAMDIAGDTRLSDRWANYGQARNCNGGSVTLPAPIDLHCP